jgi:hypothetical protein
MHSIETSVASRKNVLLHIVLPSSLLPWSSSSCSFPTTVEKLLASVLLPLPANSNCEVIDNDALDRASAIDGGRVGGLTRDHLLSPPTQSQHLLRHPCAAGTTRHRDHSTTSAKIRFCNSDLDKSTTAPPFVGVSRACISRACISRACISRACTLRACI